ncbi:MAG: DCC1-like thiol-disulfide oxidoreductase family protein [Bacteroidetes bacterium]|nr:DCC1-like thiol-disulfide oxidoreductase family protein [Bacteroidota bacterium]
MLFDGVCNFCNSSVNFIIDRDPGKRFFFASLQSGYAGKILAEYRLDQTDFDTIILVSPEGRLHKRSGAALRIAAKLRFPWCLFYAFIIVPPFLRNVFYNIVARNRYRWFGKRDACRIPTAEERERFVE